MVDPFSVWNLNRGLYDSETSNVIHDALNIQFYLDIY